MGRRLFPVARNAAKEIEDDIQLPATAAMEGVLTTMRAQPTANVLTTMRAQPTANVLTTMRAQPTAGVLTTMRAQATRH
jgi:flagellar motility protein MotE (MotC chaperone)